MSGSKVVEGCIIAAFFAISASALAGDFDDEAILVLQQHRKLNNEFLATVGSGHIEEQRLKRRALADHRENEYTGILRVLAERFCSSPRDEVLRELVATVVNTSNSAYEYPSFVLARIFACEPDRVTEEILALKPEEQKSAVDDLDWGFQNITYGKSDTFADYDNLSGRLHQIKREIAHNLQIQATP